MAAPDELAAAIKTVESESHTDPDTAVVTDATTDDPAAAEAAAAALLAQDQQLRTYIDELQTKIDTKAKLRAENTTCVRPTESHFTRLDSSLKKNTAFVKKLKQFTAAQLDTLLNDMALLNLTKYISEISTSLVEAKLKMTDISAALTLCSRLHQLYADFAATFFESWQKVLTIRPNEKIANVSKMRVDLRFFAELVAAGIFTNRVGLPLLGATLTSLISQDKDDHTNLSIILSFCRHCGEEYAGLRPRMHTETANRCDISIPVSTLLAADKQQNLRNLLRDYYQALCRHVKQEHKNFSAATRVNRKLMESKGEVSTDRKEKLELMQSNFEKLMGSVQTMSDLLNEPMPELPKDEEVAKSGMVLDMIGEWAGPCVSINYR